MTDQDMMDVISRNVLNAIYKWKDYWILDLLNQWLHRFIKAVKGNTVKTLHAY